MDRLTQAADVHIHGAKRYVGVLPPHGVEQPLAREDAAGVFQEMAEQAKLCRPQRNRLSAPADAVRGRIHFDRSEEHTSELQSLMRNSYAVFHLKKKPTLIGITSL